MKQPGLDGRHRDSNGEIRQKRSGSLTLGVGAFEKVSAVEGIRVSAGLAKDLHQMGKSRAGEAERSSFIITKYAKK